MTTSYLSEYGAQVVRIESALRPDVLRSAPPQAKGDGKSLNRSGYYANYNASKYALGLNLSSPKAIALIKRLVAWADVVTENFTPGTIERLGLGYDELRRIKPDVILFSTSMLGRGGPNSKLPGFGAVLSSLSGLTAMTGWPDRTPTNPYGAYTDFITPRFAATAILAALDHRRRTGIGQHLDLSQYEAALQFIAPALLDYANNGRQPARAANRDDTAAPHGAYPCLGDDRWIAITCLTQAHWDALLHVAHGEAWAADPRFVTLLGRKRHEDVLDQGIANWTRTQDAQALMRRLQAAGVPAGVVQSNRDVVEDEQLAHRGHFLYFDHPELGRHIVQRSEFRLSSTSVTHQWPSPAIGEHSRLICGELLGMPTEEIDALIEEGVLEVPPPASD
jgi:benzylsuccinate CoA-transferase BbsF subunit